MVLRFNNIISAFMIFIICYALLSTNAQAYDSQVMIQNGVTNHCLPELSCYKPFQVDITAGDTVTWVNQDNRTHTATAGTPNYGPEGIFDSGIISPGQSFTQFFGTIGKYHYYDKTDMWPSGLIVVSNNMSHPELSWIPGSLKIEKENYTSNGIVIIKQIQNTGNVDAHSIIFILKIKNQTSLFYNNLVKMDVPAKQSVPVKFVWENPINGPYQLFFDANSANAIGDMNANDDRSLDLISIPTVPPPAPQNPISQQNFTISSNNANIPEFGSSTSYLVLIISLVSIVIFSVKSSLKVRLLS